MRIVLSLSLSLFLLSQSPVLADEALPVSYICLETETGQILMESNADIQRPPASMLKMMLMLLVEEGLQRGDWTYDQELTVSKRAQSMGGTQAYLKAGDVLSLEYNLTALAVLSANDAAVVIAEGLWGSVEDCLLAMNNRAAELGMTQTHFYSVNGLPPADKVSFDQTSARDMAVLGLALIEHPDILKFTSQKEFVVRPGTEARSNTNKLLSTLPGCDGLKTGYIRAAGFCLTATAVQNDIRLLAVVMGSDRQGRFTHTQSLLEEAFQMVQRVKPVQAGMVIGKAIPVDKSMDEEVQLIARDTIETIIRTDQMDRLALEITAPKNLTAPVEAGMVCGQVRLMLDDHDLGISTLITERAVEKARLTDYSVGCMGRKE
ncbi:MAG: D-alanyl-D-alanine carboxypeptidase family protein [Candidatus Hydrogenedentales bacterium]|jgi:D-alanyl-D-alanine carboxypeptidase (penicillin-binding protein 5/6)